MRLRRGLWAGPRSVLRGAAIAPLLAALVQMTAAVGAAAAPSSGGGNGDLSSRLRPVVGELRQVLVQFDQTLHDIAYEHRVGFQTLARLNPDLDPWIPPPGAVVTLPTRTILPEPVPGALVINIPEMRLYDFTDPDAQAPRIHSVAVGDPDDPTPIGTFKIGHKREDPVWTVPASIRKKKPELPATVPPGPDNPLGDRWMTLGRTSYGIHGTNVRYSIGRIATHGCVRLYEDEMRALYERIPSGTPVRLVYEPFKWGTDGRRLYLEAHPDLYRRNPDRLAEALALPREMGFLDRLDIERVWRIVDEARGVPESVGILP